MKYLLLMGSVFCLNQQIAHADQVVDLCLKYSINFYQSSPEERIVALKETNQILKSQNAFCPGSMEYAIFSKSHNEKAKLNLYSELTSQALLNLENIAGQVWSEAEFKKNSSEVKKLIEEISDQKIKIKYTKWLDQVLKTEKELRPKNQRDVLKDCFPASVDMSRLPKNSLQSGENSGVGWCYAYAASQLIGYELRQAVSAPDIALTYNRIYETKKKYDYSAMTGIPGWIDPGLLKYVTKVYNQNTKHPITAEQMKKLLSSATPDLKIESGVMAEAIEGASEKGICFDQDFKSDYSADGAKPVFDVLQKLQAIGDVSNAICDKTILNRVMTRFPGIKTQDLISIFNNPNQTGDIIDLLRDRSCKRVKPHFKIKDIYCDSISYGGGISTCSQDIYKALINQLSQDKPIGIAFTPKGFNGTNGELEGHAVVVIKKKYDPQRKECLFQIRDSSKTEDYWVSEGQLMSRAFGATYLTQ